MILYFQKKEGRKKEIGGGGGGGGGEGGKQCKQHNISDADSPQGHTVINIHHNNKMG